MKVRTATSLTLYSSFVLSRFIEFLSSPQEKRSKLKKTMLRDPALSLRRVNFGGNKAHAVGCLHPGAVSSPVRGSAPHRVELLPAHTLNPAYTTGNTKSRDEKSSKVRQN